VLENGCEDNDLMNVEMRKYPECGPSTMPTGIGLYAQGGSMTGDACVELLQSQPLRR
jgi:hypothetical protein